MAFYLEDNPKIAPLTRNQKTLPEAKYYYTPIARPPKEVMDSLGDNNAMDVSLALGPDKAMDIVLADKLPVERGWCLLPEGGAYALGTTPFKGATVEMLPWWFAWFPLDDIRVKLWCPQHHQGQGTPEAVRAKMMDYSLSPKERTIDTLWYAMDTGMAGTPGAIAGMAEMRVLADAAFGVDSEKVKATGSEIMCMQLCMGGVPRCSFVHVAHPTDDGFELRSHFWFGWTFENGKPVRSAFNPDNAVLEKMCRNHVVHLLDEYYRLAGILPDLYKEFGQLED